MNQADVLITREVWNEIKASARQDIQKGVCSREEAQKILGIKKTAFYELLSDPKTKIRPSKEVTGRFIFSSIKEEFKRKHGVPYEDATR